MHPSSSVLKRGHFKSRTGCVECKKRRVKVELHRSSFGPLLSHLPSQCDESPKGCNACYKRRATCSLISSTPPPPYASPQPSPIVPNSSVNVLDLELLHNYSTKTCLSMEGHAELQEFYRTRFITEALKSDFVLHCLLGLSSFHLVQQHQELLQAAPKEQKPMIRSKIDQYLFAAQVHHSAGISTFRHTLTTISKENCHSLFAAASLIVMTSFAKSCEGVRCFTDSQTPSLEEVTRWLILLRGVKSVLTETWEWVRVGPMAPIVARRGLEDFGRNIAAMDSHAAAFLDRLSAAFSEHSESDVGQICKSEIEELRRVWRGLSNGCDYAAAFIWVVGLDSKFMALLETKCSEALLVLGAYCVLLHIKLNWRWWMRGWPRNMLRAIEVLIEERWKSWLQWPAQIIGDASTGQWEERVLVVTEGVCCR
jgi:hypothetical protein